MEIMLLRHGKPAFRLSGIVRASELKNVATSYDASGIIDQPPPELIDKMSGYDCVVCSDLQRSLESARALGYRDNLLMAPLFSEAAIPYFNRGFLALPISFWVVLLRLLWLFGFSQNGESFSATKVRAKQAANRLIELAEQHQRVLLVGHGFINHFIAKELKLIGWKGPKSSGRTYWEYSVYQLAG
jgi:broad specificity phosphatase PhoE